jgi:cytochrome c oxidase subunit II
MEFMRAGMLSANELLLADSLSIFDPASPNASSILKLAILAFAVTGLIFLIVEGVLLYSIWRFRERRPRPATTRYLSL